MVTYKILVLLIAADFSLGNVEITKSAEPNEASLNTTVPLKSGIRDKRGLDMEMPMFIIRPVENRKRIIIHDAPHSMMSAAGQKPKVYSMGPHTEFTMNEGDMFSLDKLLPVLGIHAGMKPGTFLHTMPMPKGHSHGKSSVTYKIHTVPLVQMPAAQQNEIHKYSNDQPKLYSFHNKPELKLPMTYPSKSWSGGSTSNNDYHFVRPTTEDYYMAKPQPGNEYHEFKPPMQINPYPINTIPINSIPINPSPVPHSVQSFSIHPSPVSQYQNPAITKTYYIPKTITTYPEEDNYPKHFHAQASQNLERSTEPENLNAGPTYTSRYEASSFSTERSAKVTPSGPKKYFRKDGNRQKYKAHKYSSSFSDTSDDKTHTSTTEEPNYPKPTLTIIQHNPPPHQHEYENYHMNFELKKTEEAQPLPSPQAYYQQPYLPTSGADVRPVFEAQNEGAFLPMPYTNTGDNNHAESINVPVQTYEDVTYGSPMPVMMQEGTTEAPQITTYKNSYFLTHPMTAVPFNLTEEAMPQHNHEQGDDIVSTISSTTERLASSTVSDTTCERRCVRNTVKQGYDPVCGTDGKTYNNKGKLRCAQSCGKSDLKISTHGLCVQTEKNES